MKGKATLDRRARWKQRNPWYKFLDNARTRCRCPSHVSYRFYGARGIRCLLTSNDVRYLWERDAAKLKRPSLDRINPDGHYTRGNCRFIELEENVGAARRLIKPDLTKAGLRREFSAKTRLSSDVDELCQEEEGF